MSVDNAYAVELKGVTFKRGSRSIFNNVDIRIPKGKVTGIMGPSGCGKSTTLRMIAGFVQPTSGEVLIGFDDVTALPPEKRDIGIVFQNYAIFPHMNVADNIGYALSVRGRPRPISRPRASGSKLVIRSGESGS